MRNPPVSEGEEVELTIEAVGEKGDGIAKKDGFVIFVPGAKKGQRAKIKVTKVLQKVAFGQLLGTVAVEESSANPEDDIPAVNQEVEERPEDTEDF